MNVTCTNKSCEITDCQHNGKEHEWTPACYGGCLDGGNCQESFKDRCPFSFQECRLVNPRPESCQKCLVKLVVLNN